MKCPNCKNEINDYIFECEHRCGYEEIWWCNKCGSIAIGYNKSPNKKDWKFPKNSKEKIKK